MKLSVILPCFNGAATVATQLEALARQYWSGSWEVIVSNNGSTDESMAIVEQYRDRLPNLQIVNAFDNPSLPRLGVAHSYNVGVKASQGEAFAFCEADDEIAPNWVETMGEALATHDFVTGPLDYRPLNESWLIAAHGEGLQLTGPMQPSHPPYLPFAYGCNWGMKRSVYETIGAFDETFKCAWDADYSWKAQYAGYPLTFLPELVVHYRLRSTFEGSYKQGQNWGEDYILLKKRHRVPIGRLAPVRAVISMLKKQLEKPSKKDRGAYALWSFHFGWSVGELQGLLKYNMPSFFTSQSGSLRETAGIKPAI
jgi:glycosyltransferase involved in cell wall biosynthesis